MSSRNTYLQEKEREAALIISRSLLQAKKLYDDGQRDAAGILKVVTDSLESSPLVRLEYAKICDVVTLKDVTHLGKAAVLALAVKVGATRLIDNYVFGETFDVSC